MRRPRILVVGPTPPPFHGGTVMLKHLLDSPVLNRRFELIHADSSDRRSIHNIGRLDLRNVLLSVRHLVRFTWLLLFRRPDTVYVPLSQNVLAFLRDCLFLWPAILCRRPIILHAHSSAFARFYADAPSIVRGLARGTLRRVALIIVLGESVKSQFEGLIPSDRIVVVPNGVVSPPDLASSRQTSVALYLGNLMEEKGVFVVLEAARRIQAQLPDAEVRFVGAWFRESERLRFDRTVAEENLSCVQWAGPAYGEEKWKQLSQATVVLFPPVAPEGQPLVILEAMSLGIPVISTPMGCIAEMVEDQTTGYVVPAGDADALSERAILLLRDPEAARRMGAEALRVVREQYTLERWAERLAGVFLRAIDGAKPRGEVGP